MMIIGTDEVIAEIATLLQKHAANEWYADGKKELDADVKIINFDEIMDFHLG